MFFFYSAKNVYFFKWIAYSVTVAKKKGNKNASNNHRVLISGVDTQIEFISVSASCMIDGSTL